MPAIRWSLAALAAIYLMVAVPSLISPQWLLGGLGIGADRPAGWLELRGSYGGINLVIGLALAWAAATARNQHGALALLALINAGYATGRIVGLVIDPFWSTLMVLFLVFELAVLGFALWAMGRLEPASDGASGASPGSSPRQ